MRKVVTRYIAETNEDGAVQCVWVDQDGQKSARPFNPKRECFDKSAPTEFSGASPHAIVSWIANQ